MADTYNHKIKTMQEGDGKENLTKNTPLMSWIGTSKDKNPRVVDGKGAKALLNEPNGCWAKLDPTTGVFAGLYIADTGNDCIRLAMPDGSVVTPDFKGIPDVRETSSDCTGGTCAVDFGYDEEEKK